MIQRTSTPKRIHFALLLLSLVFGAGAATAQEQQAQPAKVTASPAEQTAAARGIVQQASGLARRVSTMLDQARREKDIMRVTCLNSKLTEVNATLRNAEGRAKALADAIAAGDDSRRSHEATVLSVLGQKLQMVAQEASQCVGQDMYEAGVTKVVTEIDTSLLPFEQNASVPPAMLPPGVPDMPPASGNR